jgi:hypothetical protein
MLLPAEPLPITWQDPAESDGFEEPFFTGPNTAFLPDADKRLSARALAPRIASLLYLTKPGGSGAMLLKKGPKPASLPGQTHEISAINAQDVVSGERARRQPSPGLQFAETPLCR